MKLTNSGRVSRAETTQVGAGESTGSCNLKLARKSTLFSCPLAGGYGVGDELAVEERAEG